MYSRNESAVRFRRSPELRMSWIHAASVSYDMWTVVRDRRIGIIAGWSSITPFRF